MGTTSSALGQFLCPGGSHRGRNRALLRGGLELGLVCRGACWVGVPGGRQEGGALTGTGNGRHRQEGSQAMQCDEGQGGWGWGDMFGVRLHRTHCAPCYFCRSEELHVLNHQCSAQQVRAVWDADGELRLRDQAEQGPRQHLCSWTE